MRADRRGGVALLTIDRPAVRNAWDVPTYRELTAAIAAANDDDAVGAIVLTAAGRVYCAGVDLKAPLEPPQDSGRRPTVGTLAMAEPGGWLELLACSKPVIVAVNGAAVGLGATHVLAADIRLAAASASFRFPFLSLGTLPELGSTALLPHLVGTGRAREMLLTGRVVTAAEAERVGLVSAVHPDADLLAEAIALAGRIAELPPLQVQLTRRLLDDNGGPQRGPVLGRENQAFGMLWRSGGSARPGRPDQAFPAGRPGPGPSPPPGGDG